MNMSPIMFYVILDHSGKKSAQYVFENVNFLGSLNLSLKVFMAWGVHYIFTLRLFWHLYGYAQSTNVDRHIMSFMQL